MMTYKEYRNKRQAEFNSLPVFFAFSKEQFKAEMEKRGLKETDTKKVYSLGAGGYYLRNDAKKIRDFINRKDDLPELMKNDTFARDAFYYEMANHEYHINWQGDWDVCSCFGEVEYSEEKTYREYLSDLGYNEHTIQNFSAARRRFLHDADEKGWY